jgi:hypothetical protein
MRGALTLALVFATGALGCNPLNPATCDREPEDNPPVRYTEGTAEDGVYMSSPWEGELLWFPGGMQYRLEHKLGAEPQWINTYLSFAINGTESGRLAESAGNQVVIRQVDDVTVLVGNDTCVEYWLLVTAGVGAELPPP